MCVSKLDKERYYYMMHGITNTKICLAEQAKKMYQFKNIKARLYKTNAAIWYNKTCMKTGSCMYSIDLNLLMMGEPARNM